MDFSAENILLKLLDYVEAVSLIEENNNIM